MWTLHLFLLIATAVYATKAGDCSFKNCVFLDDDDISKLLSESILTKYQVNYLLDHYYYEKQSHDNSILKETITAEDIPSIDEPITSRTTSSIETDSPTINGTDDLENPITAYNVVTTFMSTANLLYCCGCLILTCAYIILIFWFRKDSPYIQIALTCTYHYIFHIIADLLSETISSRFLAAILYICCCNMPTICLFIYILHPDLLNAYNLLLNAYENKIEPFLLSANYANNGRWDICFIGMVPNTIFIYAILLCMTSMFTPFIYAFIFNTEFIGIFAVFTTTLYVFVITLSVFSLKSTMVNKLFSVLSKSNPFCDCRCLYASILYWVFMFTVAYFTNNAMLCTVCLVSGLNAFWWSFPLFLFIDVFSVETSVEKWEEMRNLPMDNDTINAILKLLQQKQMRYRAFIITNIVLNWAILQTCIYYSSWVAVPYSVTSLFCLSFAVKADKKWSILVHLPIAYTLFKACFAYIYIIDIATLESLSWIAPQNILIWIVTTILRLSTSFVASLQITRAIYWITIPKKEWDVVTNITDVFAHCITLYFICNVFLYFTHLEPNSLISFLFELFGISYGSTLILSIGRIFISLRKPWVFFALNIIVNLRFYVSSYLLILPRILTFIAAFLTMWVVGAYEPEAEEHWNKELNVVISWWLEIILFSVFGVLCDCKLLILTAIVLLCFVVSMHVYGATQSKRAALVVLSILAVIFIKVGLRFETGSFHELFWVEASENDRFANKTWELSVINYYFRSVFH